MIQRLSHVGLTAALAICMTLASALPANATEEPKRVTIVDACDPASFNAALGFVACVGNGDVTFAEFVAALKEDRAIDDWAFDPDQLDVVAGQSVVVKNIGGETHTFTKVAAFGPGVVPFLNQLVFGVSGPPRPEFLPFNPATNPRLNLVPAGGTLTLTTGAGKQLTLGTNLMECGIHPWMRTVITVKSSD